MIIDWLNLGCEVGAIASLIFATIRVSGGLADKSHIRRLRLLLLGFAWLEFVLLATTATALVLSSSQSWVSYLYPPTLIGVVVMSLAVATIKVTPEIEPVPTIQKVKK